MLGLLWESWPALLSARLSAIIIALLLAAKMATEDYDRGEIKWENRSPEGLRGWRRLGERVGAAGGGHRFLFCSDMAEHG